MVQWLLCLMKFVMTGFSILRESSSVIQNDRISSNKVITEPFKYRWILTIRSIQWLLFSIRMTSRIFEWFSDYFFFFFFFLMKFGMTGFSILRESSPVIQNDRISSKKGNHWTIQISMNTHTSFNSLHFHVGFFPIETVSSTSNSGQRWSGWDSFSLFTGF
jgi:hypothetical protein